MLVFVSVVKDLEITLTLLPTTVIERFLSASFKNTGVVALPMKSLSNSPLGKNFLLGADTAPPLNDKLATSALNNVNVYELSCPFLVLG